MMIDNEMYVNYVKVVLLEHICETEERAKTVVSAHDITWKGEHIIEWNVWKQN
jgi:hypothetical protein